MATRRTYGEACGIPRALDRVGERWALLVVRELLLGPKRFTDIRQGLPSLSPDVLSQRLRELEDSGVVRRRKLPPPAASQIYELTDWGAELEPVVIALGRWGARAPGPPDGVGMSLDSHIVSLQTLFDPELAGDFAANFGLRLGEQHFHAEVGDGELRVVRGDAPAPDATLDTDPGTLLALMHGHRELADVLEAGDAQLEGDRDAMARFLGLFPLPEPALPVA
jgi:DNA-binding HxlR family transcriptional regulator